MPKENIVDTTDKSLPKKDAIIEQALDRFRNTVIAERENRTEAIDDLRMLAGKDHWPSEIVRDRELEGRPTLTINKLPSFSDRIINDARINQISIKVVPNSLGASDGVAEVLNGLIKNIENESDADVARQTALEGAVNSGFGFYRVVTSFVDETSFDQEIRIERIKNNMSVYIDPHRTKHDGSDARFAFVSEMISRKEYKARYPGKPDPQPLEDAVNSPSSYWVEEDRVRVAEYWVKEPRKKSLYLLSDGRTVDGEKWDAALPQLMEQERIVHLTQDPATGQVVPVEGPAPEGSGLPEEILNEVPSIVKQRKVDSHVVVHYFIDGEKIIEGPTEWPGKYIPIIPVWGKEITIDEETFLRSAIRFAKDPQRMYNYFRTAATETVALTPKAPYVGASDQFEGYEIEWENANRSNMAYLPYNHVAGLNPPQRQVVSQTAIGEITEANIASDEMKDVTSIHDASLGIASNEVSGRAIARRQAQSDVTNFTFPDNLRRSIKYEGKILVDLIPRIYDTTRQIVIIDPEDKRRMVVINQEVPSLNGPIIINDLTQGSYGVTVTTGPAFNTLREEAAAGMLDFVRTAPDSAQVIMDLIAEAQNWPLATKIANRLKKLLPPGIDDDGPPPPQQPSIDDIIKQLKAESMTLGNEKKKLDIVDKRREMTDDMADIERLIDLLNKMKGGIDEQTNNEGR